MAAGAWNANRLIVRRAEYRVTVSLSGCLSADDPLLWRGTPVPRGAAWWERVNEPLSIGDLQRLRRSVLRGRPFGNDDWTRPAAQGLGPESCLRPSGRP